MSKLAAADNYLLEEQLPHFWCSGCGNGIILQAIARAMAELKLKKEKTVVVTGIGCWGKADDYLDTNSLHGTHGRALSFATGVKAGNPELTVLALMGDGDGATIGGNHLIHAARRNIEVTAIVSNNFNYGMTGGQYSATTPGEGKTSTSCYGNVEEDFDLCRLAEAAGAGFVARSTVYHVNQLKNLIVEALQQQCFSLIDVMSSCPTYFGRLNDLQTPGAMLDWFKERAVKSSRYQKLPPEEQQDKIEVGRLVQREVDGFTTRYQLVQKRAQACLEGGD